MTEPEIRDMLRTAAEAALWHLADAESDVLTQAKQLEQTARLAMAAMEQGDDEQSRVH